MVKGIESFKEHFADFKDRYVLIGGTASTLAMEELGVDFRATKDLDIVLCIEALDKELGSGSGNTSKPEAMRTAKRARGKGSFIAFMHPRTRNSPKCWNSFPGCPMRCRSLPTPS